MPPISRSLSAASAFSVAVRSLPPLVFPVESLLSSRSLISVASRVMSAATFGAVLAFHLPRRFVGDDGEAGERVPVFLVARVVVLMPMGVDEVAHGLARPLADLRDVFPRGRDGGARVHHQDLALADDDGGVPVYPAGKGVLVTDLVDAIGQGRDLTFARQDRVGLGGRRGEDGQEHREQGQGAMPGETGGRCAHFDSPSPIMVALACGFADQSHLTRAFRRRYGISPGQLRRRTG